MRIIPLLKYNDAHAMIGWLCEVFGFHERLVVPGPGDSIRHAQLQRGQSIIMLNSIETEGFRSPAELGACSSVIYVVDADVDGVYASAVEAGADVLQTPVTDEHGIRSVQVRDPEGHVWSFCTYDPLA